MNSATYIPDIRLFYAMVREHVDDKNLWDDCVQEAAIHDWRLRRMGVPHSDAYYHKAARRKIQDMARRQTWTGHSGRHGHPIDPLRRSHDSLDEIRENQLVREQ